MANPNPKPSPATQIKKGQVLNPTGTNLHRKIGLNRRADLNNLCLVDIEKIIERWRHFALTEEPKYAFQYGKDLMDRGLGKPVQTAIIKSEEGKPMSMQTAYDALNNTIIIQEERDTLRKEVEELREQVKKLSSKGKKKADVIDGEVIE